ASQHSVMRGSIGFPLLVSVPACPAVCWLSKGIPPMLSQERGETPRPPGAEGANHHPGKQAKGRRTRKTERAKTGKEVRIGSASFLSLRAFALSRFRVLNRRVRLPELWFTCQTRPKIMLRSPLDHRPKV